MAQHEGAARKIARNIKRNQSMAACGGGKIIKRSENNGVMQREKRMWRHHGISGVKWQ